VTFGANRENIAMPLYRIENGHTVYLGVGQSQPDQATDSDTPEDSSTE
jgi:hypothetical protein